MGGRGISATPKLCLWHLSLCLSQKLIVTCFGVCTGIILSINLANIGYICPVCHTILHWFVVVVCTSCIFVYCIQYVLLHIICCGLSVAVMSILCSLQDILPTLLFYVCPWTLVWLMIHSCHVLEKKNFNLYFVSFISSFGIHLIVVRQIFILHITSNITRTRIIASVLTVISFEYCLSVAECLSYIWEVLCSYLTCHWES